MDAWTITAVLFAGSVIAMLVADLIGLFLLLGGRPDVPIEPEIRVLWFRDDREGL